MDLHVDNVGDVAMVTVPIDHLDAKNHKEFMDDMQSLLKEHSKLVLDLGDVQFADSSGIGALLFCIRQIRECGGDIKICCLSGPVEMAFELVQMQRLVDSYETCEKALKAFQD
jgi:anti-sigma B factor antagonist